MEISELFQLFSEKVAQQTEQIENISSNIIESKIHVDKGVKELTKATKSGVDFRIFVLLFLIICSFSLLFLHWIT